MLRLKELREEKNISQKKLAEDLSISQASVSKYEKGLAEPNLQLLCRTAESFHVSVDYLIRKSEQKNSIRRILCQRKMYSCCIASMLWFPISKKRCR